MEWIKESCTDFTAALAAGTPTPGGGGAAAMVSAIGTALGSMVANLTIGREKYREIEPEMKELCAKTEMLRLRLLSLVKKDADGFEALMASFRLPKSSEDEQRFRKASISEHTKRACDAPLEIMESCREALQIFQIFAEKGNVNAISDVSCGAIFCKAGMEAAAFSIEINMYSFSDRAYADQLLTKIKEMQIEAVQKTEEILAIAKNRT